MFRHGFVIDDPGSVGEQMGKANGFTGNKWIIKVKRQVNADGVFHSEGTLFNRFNHGCGRERFADGSQ